MNQNNEEISIKTVQVGLDALGLVLPEQAILSLVAYIELLFKWNQTYNLTALRHKSQMLTHHVFDSLSVVADITKGLSLIDVGSGGGMPGIPLAIARPDLNITLIDSNSKKTTFLTQAVLSLGLSNVKVCCGRVEILQNSPYDIVISRAFAELNDFVNITRHLLKADGVWLAMKGTYPYDELSRLPDWVAVEAVKPISVPSIDAERHLVSMRLKKEAV